MAIGYMNRTILHVDMNSYFASVEQQANPLLRGKAIAVSGPGALRLPGSTPGNPSPRSVVAAASIEAKARGVKTAMPYFMAKQICPELIFVVCHPERYHDVTQRFLRILEHYTPIMEIFSMDEAFLDVTDTQTYFGGSIALAHRIKTDIRAEMGDWVRCSIGIASGKILAKLASELKKPDGLVVLKDQDIARTLAKVPLTDLCGIAHRTAAHMRAIGICTFADLAAYPTGVLKKEFGVRGVELQMIALGQDRTPVIPYNQVPPRKSIGHAYTLPFNSADPKKVLGVLMRLCEQVARRARDAGMVGEEVSAGVRFNHMGFAYNHQRLDSFTNNARILYQVCEKLILPFTSCRVPVRLLSVTLHRLAFGTQVQLPLCSGERAQRQLDTAMDKINDRYGEFIVRRASLVRYDGWHKESPGYAMNKRIKIAERFDEFS